MLQQIRNLGIRKGFCPTVFAAITNQTTAKSPNILVNAVNEDQFTCLRKLLTTVLEEDWYTVHYLSESKFLSQSWKQSCCLLMIQLDGGISINVNTSSIMQRYLSESNGCILFYTVGNEDKWLQNKEHLKSFLDKKTGENIALIDNVFSTSSKEILIDLLRKMGLHTAQKVTESCKHYQSPAFFISLDQTKLRDVFCVESGKNHIPGKDITLTFTESTAGIPLQESGERNELLISTEACNSKLFKAELYKTCLKSRIYGRNMIYTDTINSTQTVFTGLNFFAFKTDGVIVHAKRQLKGKGRSGNQWLSPIGCMMFSMQIEIPVKSLLGNKLSLIQHLIVVAFVVSIKNRMQGYEKLCLGIKWPNDIYINKKTKIGGVIVNSSALDGLFKVVVGLGVNVHNDRPTECLNSLIREYNARNSCNLPELEVEDVLGGVVSAIEFLVDCFQENGIDDFKKLYYKHWLHSDAEITLGCRNNEKAVIVGIDDFGYLKVRLVDTGEVVLLQPDGNSFDMMNNMIILKT